MNAEHRALAWVRVKRKYVFDGPTGKVTLAERGTHVVVADVEEPAAAVAGRRSVLRHDAIIGGLADRQL